MPKLADKIPIAVLIGAGSKLPAIIKAAKSPKGKFYISIVVSHKSFSPGVALAISQKIPAVYFKLPDYRNRLLAGSQKARASYMGYLGWFISQREYLPRLLVFAGWDLVMDENFLNFFKADFGNGFAAINLHPGLMPLPSEGRSIRLPDGSKSPVIKGEQKEVLTMVLKKRLTYFGPSIHFMVADKYDVGKVIKRQFIKVLPKDTIDSLRKKLMPVEDRLLIESINEIIGNYLL